MLHATYVLGGAALLALGASLLSRALATASRTREELVRSAAGGVTVAFVILDLFVDLARGSVEELHEIIRAGPEPVHTVAVLLLVGTLGSFVAASRVARAGSERARHVVALVPHCAYTFLVGGTLAEQANEGVAAAALYCVAMAVHLGVVDQRFAERFPNRHRSWPRLAASVSVVAGATVWTLAEPSPGVFQLTLALVAGGTLLLAFREELPLPQRANAGAIVAGAALVTLLQELRWWT